MKKFYYYAELNDNNVCVRIVSDTVKKVGSDRHIEIPEYNETLVYKKWLDDQWSSESYEPSVDTVIQEKLIALETIIESQSITILGLTNENTSLNTRVVELEELLASYIGGAI